MAPRRTQPKNLRRRTGHRPERKTVLIFCEGEASEPDYITAVKRLPHVQRNVAVNIEIDPERGVPLTLVERAAARLKSDAEIDECWCVFDVEWPLHHPTRAAESLSKRLDGRTSKRIDGAKYLPLRRDASKRAAALVDRHLRHQTPFPNDNPSSTMHELLAAIEPED